MLILEPLVYIYKLRLALSHVADLSFVYVIEWNQGLLYYRKSIWNTTSCLTYLQEQTSSFGHSPRSK